MNLFFATVALAAKSVTLSGASSGFLLGTWIYGCLGVRGFSVMATFFILGTLFTRWGYGTKKERGIAQKREGRRTYREVLANCSVGALLASLVFFTGKSFYQLAFVASFATALADTTATELGPLYGRTTFLVPSFKKVSPGTPGGVSFEGTLLGIGAGTVLTLLACFLTLVRKEEMPLVVVGSAIGFLVESFLIRSAFLGGHETRNFLNTFFGAIAVIILASLFL
ncbi:MAG: DUF92 domain-containing protein [Candidatus Omnitrophica bacterium]|nr:DUF92 domain-containing protein [Candidatus Omnitrophota bacterium]